MPKCPYCNKEVEELTSLEIFLNEESIGKVECCESCVQVMETATKEPEFEQMFKSYITDLSENWEPGNKDNTKVGSTIRIINLENDPQNYQYIGREGVVILIDDIGTLHGTWGGVGVIPGTDSYLISKVSTETEVKEND